MSIHDQYIFKDGSRPDIGTIDFMKYEINEAVSEQSTFSIGAAVIKKYTATLNNMEEKFSDFDFEGLDILARVGLLLEDGTVEIIPKGKYRCVNAKLNESTIDLEAYDSMLFFDRPYSESTLQYPATITQIINDACVHCQMAVDEKTIPWGGHIIKKRPDDKDLTFRDMIGYCAQIMCCYAKIDHLDKLSFGWYDFETLEKMQNGYDGGNLEDYATGDKLDGGNFKNYSEGDFYDSGSFRDTYEYHHFYSLGSQSINTDDIIVTGIKVTSEKTDDSEEESYMYGGDGYVLSIEKNPLIQTGDVQIVASYIGKKMAGKRFRPLSISCQSDPCIEAGDCACVTDRKQRTFFSVISNTTFSVGSMQKIECTAETPTENNYTKYSVTTKLLDAADRNAKRELSSYDIAVKRLTDLMTQSFGLYKTEEVQEDGSVIFYMHNKPEVSNSSTIWKMTADAFAVSTDGGKTWNAGMDSQGNAVVTILNAIGVNADWINTGNLIVGGKDHNADGSIRIYDKDGKILGILNKDGIDLNGSFHSSGVWTDEETGDSYKYTTSIEDGSIRVLMENGYYCGIDVKDGATCIALGKKDESETTIDNVLTKTTNLRVLNKADFLDAEVNIDSAVAKTMQITESIKGKNNDVVMEMGEVTHAARFPQHTVFENITINEGVIQNLTTSKTDFYFIGSGGAGIEGSFVRSGVFVVLYGTAHVSSLDTNKYMEIPMVEDVKNPVPDELLPKHYRVKTTTNGPGGRIFMFTFNTKGLMQIRNCGSKYETDTAVDVTFRFDYFLI
nr:MAG TPA: BNR/Asp-box repeat protein [Caudoviricetes sp.]